MPSLAILATESADHCLAPQPPVQLVLGNSLVLDLEKFPELDWLSDYFTCLNQLQAECDRLTQAIHAIENEGEVYHDYWIETYTKSKNGKHYTYYQLRWLTGERKNSGQPKVETKHLSHHAVGEIRAAIARGQQVEVLQKQQRQVEAEILKLKHLVRGTGRRLLRVSSQNCIANQSNYLQ